MAIAQKIIEKYPLVAFLAALEELSWFNPDITSLEEGLPYVGLGEKDIEDAAKRLARFAPYLAKAFPETAPTNGIIESELVDIPVMKERLERQYETRINGRMMLKKDSHLPISGSIKARGGLYEVLVHAERLAVAAGLMTRTDDYSRLFSERFRNFFRQYGIAVGSTGNLGLSVGIMGTKLGFSVFVHMSQDAREWKKNMLRSYGAHVFEYEDDFGNAISQGREEAEKDPSCFFIDDEKSKNLFLGYSVAGKRLKRQFADMGITVDENHPLFVYLPCGVGGGPGGVAFGLKTALGAHVHCIFAEPTHSPSMLLGVHTGLHDGISVQDIGIDNITAADGLAVGRASEFVGRAMERLVDGYYTISDERMYSLLGVLSDSEGIRLEPSALAGMVGPVVVDANDDYKRRMAFDDARMKNATHLVWATGGGMVPEQEMSSYLARSKEVRNTVSLNPYQVSRPAR